MLSSTFDMVRQRRPTGPMWTVDDTWKKDVLVRMKSKGISRADLAHLLGVSPASITQLFKPETKQTRLKPAIHRHLGLVVPTSTPAITRDEALSRFLRVWKDLNEEQREHVIRTGEMLKGR